MTWQMYNSLKPFPSSDNNVLYLYSESQDKASGWKEIKITINHFTVFIISISNNLEMTTV